LFIGTVIGGALWRDHDLQIKQQAEIEKVLEMERAVTCPALLSIARTPRDTLIVMKNKPVCVEYVFDNMD